MSIAALEAKALRHWKEWLPKKGAALRAEGRLEKAAHGAALMAQDQIEHLMTYRHYPEWAAEEVKSAEGHQQKTDRRDEHGSHLEMLRSHDAD